MLISERTATVKNVFVDMISAGRSKCLFGDKNNDRWYVSLFKQLYVLYCSPTVYIRIYIVSFSQLALILCGLNAKLVLKT